jgi:hypothetical protein
VQQLAALFKNDEHGVEKVLLRRYNPTFILPAAVGLLKWVALEQ